MSSHRALVLPLLLLAVGCGARTFISERSDETGNAPLEARLDGGSGYATSVPELRPTDDGEMAIAPIPEPPPVQQPPPVRPPPPSQPPVVLTPPDATTQPPSPPVTAVATATPAPTVVEPEVPSEPEVPVEPIMEPDILVEPALEPEVIEETPGACDTPLDLGSEVGAVAFGTNYAASDRVYASCGTSGGRDITFTWTAPSSGVFSFDTVGSDYDTTLTLHEGGGCMNEVACNDDTDGVQSHLTYDVAEGDVLGVVLDAYNGNAIGTYALNINQYDTAECIPIVLGSETGLVAQGAFPEDAAFFGSGSDCSGGARRVYYEWLAPLDGTYRFDTLGSEFDTVLVLRSACGEPMLACNDDSSQITASMIEWSLSSGESVVIEVSKYGDTSPRPDTSESAAFELNIENVDPTEFGDAGVSP
jgi:hypothetical protein